MGLHWLGLQLQVQNPVSTQIFNSWELSKVLTDFIPISDPVGQGLSQCFCTHNTLTALLPPLSNQMLFMTSVTSQANLHLVYFLLQFIILHHQLYAPIGIPLGKENSRGIIGENNIVNKD